MQRREQEANAANGNVSSSQQKLKPMAFRDVKGRKKLRNEFAADDAYYDEDSLLSAQLKLYSNENIVALQSEYIEMDLLVDAHANDEKNGEEQRMHSNDSALSEYSAQSLRKLPPE